MDVAGSFDDVSLICNMQYLALPGLEFHLPVYLPLLKLIEVLLKLDGIFHTLVLSIEDTVVSNQLSHCSLFQCWSESGLGLGLNGWVRVRVRTRVRTRTLPLWTRTRTPPRWTRTQALWTRNLVSGTRTRTPPRWTRTHSESRWVRWEM